ncbi:MAG: YebC/PmpR family DNA-binding regulatory protein [Myxococcota bacterium]|jgi:YebC/PmpR family DNA-binding regulatory protein
MGRIFETRKATMFKRWDRMAKAFTRVGKEIAIAVRSGGPSPENNAQLRRAMQNARAVNMPKDRVEAAIKKASGEGAEDYDILLYEAYAPHGIALMVETATDNSTRTVANVRMYLKKGEGNLGTSGSVSFMFDRVGVFRLDPQAVGDREELELDLIDFGLEEMGDGKDEDGNPVVVLHCDFNEFGTLQSALEERGIEPVSSESEYIPQNLIDLGDEESEAVLALVDMLEQDDDVQRVFHNLA